MRRIIALFSLLLYICLLTLLIPSNDNDSRRISGSIENYGEKFGWQLQNRYPTSEFLTGVDFINLKEGWICGLNGTLFRTNDGGKSWTKKQPDNKDFHRLYFFDPKIGIAINYDGFVYKTTNGGENWKLIFSSPKYIINSLQEFKDKIIFSGYDKKTMRIPIFFSLIKSNNNIAIRRFINISLLDEFRISREPKTHLIDDENIIICTRHKVFLSNDAGILWKKVYEFPHPYPYHSLTIYFKDKKKGFIFADNIVLTTEDGGSTWKKSIVGHSGNCISEITFADEINGNAVGFNRNELGSLLLKTDDGGNTWKKIEGFEYIYKLIDIDFVDKKNGWICGSGGAVLHTKDGGKTWKTQSKGSPQTLRKCFFLNKKTGWIIGGDLKQSNVIIHTNDGGKTWNKQYENKNKSLKSIIFTDKKSGWVTGSEGLLLYTEDGGKTWWKKESPHTDETLFNIDFINKNNGWILGENKIYKTDDGGDIWNPIHSNKIRDYYSDYYFKFFNQKRGFVVGPYFSGETKDGGISWKKINLSCNAFFFLSSGKGWKCEDNVETYSSSIYFTDNFGEKWDPIGVFPTKAVICDMFFTDLKNGYIITGDGSSLPYGGSDIYKTIDGGKTWSHQNTGTLNLLKKIFFVDSENGWIIGDFGTILHTILP